MQGINDDCVVDVQDLVNVILGWGNTDCDPEDTNFDGIVDVQDLISLILAWGPCPESGAAQPLSLEQEFLAAGLTEDDSDDFLANLDDENYHCWTAHYLDDNTCHPLCTQPPQVRPSL